MGRKSTGEYPENWKEISEQVKIDADWKCIRCEYVHDITAGYMLTVHHIDLNKSNCEWWNLAALCQRCHLIIQAKVVIERIWMFEHSEWFKPYVAGYYAHQNNLPEDKVYVMANLDDLLNLGYMSQENSVLFTTREGVDIHIHGSPSEETINAFAEIADLLNNQSKEDGKNESIKQRKDPICKCGHPASEHGGQVDWGCEGIPDCDCELSRIDVIIEADKPELPAGDEKRYHSV